MLKMPTRLKYSEFRSLTKRSNLMSTSASEWKSNKTLLIFLDINKTHELEFDPYDSNYENIPFYLEVAVYTQKFRFWDKKLEEVISEFSRAKMKKSQTVTMQIKNAGKGLWKYLFLNFKDDLLSHCIGSIHTLLVNFIHKEYKQHLSSSSKKSLNYKENEDYIHIGSK